MNQVFLTRLSRRLARTECGRTGVFATRGVRGGVEDDTALARRSRIGLLLGSLRRSLAR